MCANCFPNNSAKSSILESYGLTLGRGYGLCPCPLEDYSCIGESYFYSSKAPRKQFL